MRPQSVQDPPGLTAEVAGCGWRKSGILIDCDHAATAKEHKSETVNAVANGSSNQRALVVADEFKHYSDKPWIK